jgi:hypothetical protein
MYLYHGVFASVCAAWMSYFHFTVQMGCLEKDTARLVIHRYDKVLKGRDIRDDMNM